VLSCLHLHVSAARPNPGRCPHTLLACLGIRQRLRVGTLPHGPLGSPYQRTASPPPGTAPPRPWPTRSAEAPEGSCPVAAWLR
jgi:hypothetical protein